VRRKGLISGITGQEDSYLAGHLLEPEFEVQGLVRCIALNNRMSGSGVWATSSGGRDSTRAVSRVQPSYSRSWRKHFDTTIIWLHEVCRLELRRRLFLTMNTNTNPNGTHYLLATLHELQPRVSLISLAAVRCSAMYTRRRNVSQPRSTPSAKSPDTV